MKVTDQPGRIAAVLLFCPALLAVGIILLNTVSHNAPIGISIVVFAAIFFVYELFWLNKAQKCALI